MGKIALRLKKVSFKSVLLAILMVITPGGFMLGGAYIAFGYLQARLRKKNKDKSNDE
jgi:hypothetical protein